jgi:hypothetical protein
VVENKSQGPGTGDVCHLCVRQMLTGMCVEGRFVDVDALKPEHGALVVAWVATKFTEPLRLALALAITPRPHPS